MVRDVRNLSFHTRKISPRFDSQLRKIARPNYRVWKLSYEISLFLRFFRALNDISFDHGNIADISFRLKRRYFIFQLGINIRGKNSTKYRRQFGRTMHESQEAAGYGTKTRKPSYRPYTVTCIVRSGNQFLLAAIGTAI